MDTPASKTHQTEPVQWFQIEPVKLHPANKTAAENYKNELLNQAREEHLPRLTQCLEEANTISNFIATVLDLSPFLRETLIAKPHLLEALFSVSAQSRIAQLTIEIPQLGLEIDTEAELMAALRIAKSEVHVLIALCDLAGVIDAEKTTQLVSELAVACVQATIRFLLLNASRAGKLRLPNLEKPELGSGWIILGLGKLGARELNYSSDIDLIVLFDPERNTLPDRFEGIEVYSRMTRQLVRILQDRTGDGYVFRTDMRLRPDPGSTPLAIPVEAALNYYESRGQNWERAALIKANPIAGDIEAGKKFLEDLTPFIWRKYLDYAAIADVHSIKRQIHAHKGHGEIAVLGHNVKLGRGGIREVEFFVQTQQLIAGGRDPELRGRGTAEMLASLAAKRWITAEAANRLKIEYWFLRSVENRIQMIADEQTHTLPDTEAELLRIAMMMGFNTLQDFSSRMRQSLQSVEYFYAALFESAPELSASLGNLVFTGDNDDPGTIETLQSLGFTRPSDMCRIIRIWHFGRYKATQSSEARERLTELTPALLKAFGASPRPDETLLQFDAFLQGLPSGIQLFSLLQSNVTLLELLVKIMGAAPRLSNIVTHRPHIFDGLLDPAIYRDVPTPEYLSGRLDAFMVGNIGYEESLDRLRIFNAEQKFLIGVRILTGALSPLRAGAVFSDLADLMLQRIFAVVKTEFERKHGTVQGADVGLLAFGKLGSRELTAGSDLDLILLYEHSEEASESNGEKPLFLSQYYTRLTQRLITAVSAPTAEGILYELDLRLRPSGNKGPVATRLSAFERYQEQDAWTWEHMALTRARVVLATGNFQGKVESVIRAVLVQERDRKKTLLDMLEMRKTLEQEKPSNGPWDLKLMPGGLIDLEFIAQASVLSGYCKPDFGVSTQQILKAAVFKEMDINEQQILLDAHQLYSSITQVLRLCLDDDSTQPELNNALLDILRHVAEMPNTQTLEAHIADTAKQVRRLFNLFFR